jgi:hypothetical protein
MATFTARPGTATVQQVCQIISVDLINLRAVAYTRQQTNITIDLSYYVGAAHVIPSNGDQWLVSWYGTAWKLDTQLAHATTELTTVADFPVQGLTQIGDTNPSSAGPTHINGGAIYLNAPTQLYSVPTTGRPSASGVPGRIIFDSTLGQILFSDGSAWDPIGSGGGGGGGITTVIGEVPTGTKDGSNAVFIVGHSFQTASTAVYRNGLRERLGVGYTESGGNTLTFTTAPLTDDDLSVDYVLQ